MEPSSLRPSVGQDAYRARQDAYRARQGARGVHEDAVSSGALAPLLFAEGLQKT
jgi:hypothetical protein